MAAAVPISAAEGGRARLSARRDRQFGFGLASVLLHAAVLGGVAIVLTPALTPAPPDEATVELVFEQAAPPPEAQPEVPPPAVEAPPPEPEPALTPPPEPEPVPPPPEPAPVQPPPEPVPVPPPPEPAPMPPPPPNPKAPPVRRAPPKPVARAPVAVPAPRGEPAPQAPVAAPVAPVAPVVDPRWAAAVSGWLAARKTYPEEARRRGEEGRVAIRFTVDRSGRVVEAAIVTASGSALLDEAALGLLRQAVFPAFPPDMTQVRVTITTTVRYSLR